MEVESPRLCAVLGVPTTRRVWLSVEHITGIERSWLSLAFLAIGHLHFRTRGRKVAWRAGLTRRASLARVLSLTGGLLFGVTLATGVVGLALVRDRASTHLTAAGGVGFLLCAAAWSKFTVRVAWVDETDVVFRNLHPRFEAALLTLLYSS